jgi:hypothetical protein
MPQVALHRVIQEGIAILKKNPDILDNIFEYYTCPGLDKDYGQNYIDKIKEWFTTTKIPVMQAWSLNPQRVPQIGIKLASEQEDESLVGIGDHWGDGEEATIGVSPSVVQLDVVIMTSRNGDESLWLYYIVSYLLLKRKRRAEELGLQKHTWSASDYNRNAAKLADNIWERYIRFRTTVQNLWDNEEFLDIDDLDVDLDAESISGNQVVDI